MNTARSIYIGVLFSMLFFCMAYSACVKQNRCASNCIYGNCAGETCTCNSGYTGSDCNNLLFEGTWKGTDSCTSGSPVNTLTITWHRGYDATYIQVDQGYEYPPEATLSADARTLSFPAHEVSSSGTMVSGTLTLTGDNTLSFSYVSSYVGGSDTCKGYYTRQ